MERVTPRLVLRPPHAADLDTLFAIYGDAATNAFNPAGPLPSVDAAQALLERWLAQWRALSLGPWAIATRADPLRVIGFGGISQHAYLEQTRINLGYRFAAPAWGRGFATELGMAALDFGFNEYGVDDIYALVRPAHAASIRVLEKIGMRRVGTLDDVPGQDPSLVFLISRPLVRVR